jgi:hypothetical protein
VKELKFVIDRFEEEYAVVELENKDIVNIPIKILPKEVKEGDVIKILVDYEETAIREELIKEKFNNLFEE